MKQEISNAIPTEGSEMSRRTLLTHLVPAAGAAAILGTVASPALAKSSSGGESETMLFYNGSTGLTVTGRLNSDGTFSQLNTYHFAATWTHLVGINGMILFYNINNGAGASARLDSNGVLTLLKTSTGHPSFSPGWTTVMESNGLLFFYNSHTGDGATGSIDNAGNVIQVQSFAGTFSTGWTVVTSNR